MPCLAWHSLESAAHSLQELPTLEKLPFRGALSYLRRPHSEPGNSAEFWISCFQTCNNHYSGSPLADDRNICKTLRLCTCLAVLACGMVLDAFALTSAERLERTESNAWFPLPERFPPCTRPSSEPSCEVALAQLFGSDFCHRGDAVQTL